MNDLKKIPVHTQDEVVQALTSLIREPLEQGKKVLWLISGGSSVPVAAAVSNNLQSSDTTNLFITLVDDKLGDTRNSNWQQLHDMPGFTLGKSSDFNPQDPTLLPNEMAQKFNVLLEERLGWADVSIGQFGIGSDYHTGGILPNSPAADEKDKLAVAYEHDGTGKITITPVTIRRLDVAFINSMSEAKRDIVAHFINSTSTITNEPAQSLKTTAKVYLYSDVL